MICTPTKYSADFFLKVSGKKFHNSEGLEDFDAGHHDAPINLSSKIVEYMVCIGDSNDFCFNTIVQLLTEGKVRVDFRDSTERLQLVNKQDRISWVEAAKGFDHWVQENRGKLERFESTRKVVLEPPRAKLPLTRS
jgi:hypothetical protein